MVDKSSSQKKGKLAPNIVENRDIAYVIALYAFFLA